MQSRRIVLCATLVLCAGLSACTGGDSSPEDAAGGGIPPQSSVSPAPNLGVSEGGFPDSDSAGEAQQ